MPDLITLVTLEDGEPIGTEALRYGLRVAVLAMPAPKELKTPEALAVVGPRAFGYDLDFHPLPGRFVVIHGSRCFPRLGWQIMPRYNNDARHPAKAEKQTGLGGERERASDMADLIKDKATSEGTVGSQSALMDVVVAMHKLTLEEQAQLLEYLSRALQYGIGDGKRSMMNPGKSLLSAASGACQICGLGAMNSATAKFTKSWNDLPVRYRHLHIPSKWTRTTGEAECGSSARIRDRHQRFDDGGNVLRRC